MNRKLAPLRRFIGLANLLRASIAIALVGNLLTAQGEPTAKTYFEQGILARSGEWSTF